MAAAKARVAAAFGRAAGPRSGEWLRNQLKSETNATVRRILARSLAAQPVDPANVPHLAAGLRDAERDDVLPLAAALGRHRPALTRELAQSCLQHMAASTRLVTGLERLLVMVSGRQRPGYQADRDPNARVEESVRQAALQDWAQWYQAQFGEAHPLAGPATTKERSDEELHGWLLGGCRPGRFSPARCRGLRTAPMPHMPRRRRRPRTGGTNLRTRSGGRHAKVVTD